MQFRCWPGRARTKELNPVRIEAFQAFPNRGLFRSPLSNFVVLDYKVATILWSQPPLPIRSSESSITPRLDFVLMRAKLQ